MLENVTSYIHYIIIINLYALKNVLQENIKTNFNKGSLHVRCKWGKTMLIKGLIKDYAYKKHAKIQKE